MLSRDTFLIEINNAHHFSFLLELGLWLELWTLGLAQISLDISCLHTHSYMKDRNGTHCAYVKSLPLLFISIYIIT